MFTKISQNTPKIVHFLTNFLGGGGMAPHPLTICSLRSLNRSCNSHPFLFHLLFSSLLYSFLTKSPLLLYSLLTKSPLFVLEDRGSEIKLYPLLIDVEHYCGGLSTLVPLSPIGWLRSVRMPDITLYSCAMSFLGCPHN